MLSFKALGRNLLCWALALLLGVTGSLNREYDSAGMVLLWLCDGSGSGSGSDSGSGVSMAALMMLLASGVGAVGLWLLAVYDGSGSASIVLASSAVCC